MLKYLIVLCLAAAQLSCSTISKSGKISERKDEALITEEYALWRSSKVSNVSYDLNIDLTEKENYTGAISLSFNLDEANAPLTVDYRKGQVKTLTINGKTPKAIQQKQNFLVLDQELLVKGQNSVVIEFQSPYSRSGSGLYRFEDVEDNRSYLYTDFEPYDANLFVPLFDQPDLKATYKMTVTAPKDWVVVTSVLESKKTKAKNALVWHFPESQRFSTYIFSLHAGPYKVWKANAGSIPLRFFARQSLAKYVKINDWIQATQQGFEFYNKYFAYPYPFNKYDQLIVPDFNSGAMENVAAVTFSERFVNRGPKTQAERRSLSSVILHEMAHMWFGDLVTMRWWNGLWLNESFATYMAALAMYENTEFKSSWKQFYQGSKAWAYWEDQLVTTHPIELPVPSSDAAFANFDGITYGKGASTLKQLSFYAGAENFQKGLQAYFQTHAFKNTELKDFTGAIATASGKDLNAWSKEWLETSGVNTLAADYTCADNKVTKLTLVQTDPAQGKYLRTHKTRIGFFTEKDGKIVSTDSLDVEYSGAKTEVAAAVGKDCPQIVYTNFEDFDYANEQLDEKTISKLKQSISSVDHDLSRLMFWNAMWDMVYYGKSPAIGYIETVMNNIRFEKEIDIATSAVKKIYGSTRGDNTALDYLPKSTDAEKAEYKDVVTRLEKLFSEELQKASPSSDFQKLWLSSLIGTSQSEKALKLLADIYAGKKKYKGLVVDQDYRWSIITRLNQFNFPGSLELIAKERKLDSSSRGEKAAMAAEAIRPDIDTKNRWYANIVDANSKFTVSEKREMLANIFPVTQSDLQEKFAGRFYEDLIKLKDSDPQFLRRFTAIVYSSCDQDAANNIKKFVQKQNKVLPATVTKGLKVQAQEAERCAKARAL